jgi:hypothetical protein
LSFVGVHQRALWFFPSFINTAKELGFLWTFQIYLLTRKKTFS